MQCVPHILMTQMWLLGIGLLKSGTGSQINPLKIPKIGAPLNLVWFCSSKCSSLNYHRFLQLEVKSYFFPILASHQVALKEHSRKHECKIPTNVSSNNWKDWLKL